MRTTRNFLASLFAGLLVIVALGVTASQASAAGPLVTGITVPDAGLSPQLGYDRIAEAGAKFTRVAGSWSHVAPKEEPANWDPTDPADPNYSWAEFDHQVISAVNAGVTPLVQVHGAPSWAERCVAKNYPGICNPDPTDFQHFAAAAAKRYSGTFEGLPRVRYWQPWNEPNLILSFSPQRVGKKRPSPALYRTLLNRFAAAVKNVDSSNMVVGGGLAPLGGTLSIGPLAFTRRMLCMQGRKRPKPIRGCRGTARFDIFAINPYTTGGPTQHARSADDVQMGDIPEMVRLIRAARNRGKIKSAKRNVPIWVTEFSWDSRPPDPKGLRMGILCRWTSEALYRAWKAGVSNFFWLSIRDWPHKKFLDYTETIESGLWFRGKTIEQDKPKRVLKAFRFPFVAFRGKRAKGITVWGRTPTSKSGRVVIRFGRRYGKVNRRVKVVRTNRFGVFRAFVRTRLGRNQRGFLNATFGGETSLPFSLKPVKNFRQPPFGG